MDEMWSFVGNKGNPRWLWHAIDHHTSKVLAYVFGRRKDDVFGVCSGCMQKLVIATIVQKSKLFRSASCLDVRLGKINGLCARFG